MRGAQAVVGGPEDGVGARQLGKRFIGLRAGEPCCNQQKNPESGFPSRRVREGEDAAGLGTGAAFGDGAAGSETGAPFGCGAGRPKTGARWGRERGAQTH